MANLEIKLTLDGSNDEMAEVTGKLLSALGQSNVEFKASTSATTTADESEKKDIEDEKAKKAAALKAKKAAEAKAKKEAAEKAAKEAAKNAEPSEEESESDEESETSDDEGPTVTIEQIKSLMAKKISDHRDNIKKQMTKIGAQNVSTIPVDKYDSFHSFLEGLD